MLILVVMMVVIVPTVLGYGSGAPISACQSLMPNHKEVSPQSDDSSPYTLEVSSDEYYGGSILTVKIMGAQYGGFLLQARRDGGEDTSPVGSWMAQAGSTQTRDCVNPKDALTHVSSQLKGPIQFKWKAPSQIVGNIRFVATIAEKRSKYWLNHKSALVEAKEGEDPNPQPEGGEEEEKPDTKAKGDGAIAVIGLHPLWMVVVSVGCFLIKF